MLYHFNLFITFLSLYEKTNKQDLAIVAYILLAEVSSRDTGIMFCI